MTRKLNSLRLARLMAGKSQFEVAVETGLSQTVISLFERELRKPRTPELRKLADAYGVPVDRLQEATCTP